MSSLVVELAKLNSPNARLDDSRRNVFNVRLVPDQNGEGHRTLLLGKEVAFSDRLCLQQVREMNYLGDLGRNGGRCVFGQGYINVSVPSSTGRDGEAGATDFRVEQNVLGRARFSSSEKPTIAIHLDV